MPRKQRIFMENVDPMTDLFFNEFSPCGPQLHMMVDASTGRKYEELIGSVSEPSFFKSAYNHCFQGRMKQGPRQEVEPGLAAPGLSIVN